MHNIAANLFDFVTESDYRICAYLEYIYPNRWQPIVRFHWMHAALLGITSTALVIFYLLWQRPAGIQVFVLFLSALAGLTAFYLPYRQQQIARMVPPIHDITTSIENPPAFVAIAPLRASAPNPAEYLGGETSDLQRQFYPDIMSRIYI